MRRSILVSVLLAALPFVTAQDVASAVATNLVNITSVAESVSSSVEASGSSGSTGMVGGAMTTSGAASSSGDSSSAMGSSETTAPTLLAIASDMSASTMGSTSSGNFAPLLTAMPAVGGLLGLGMVALAAL